MSTAERKLAFFATHTKVQGEAMESDLEKVVVQLRCVEGDLQPDLLVLSRDRIFSTLKAAKVMFADSCEDVSFGVLVSDKRLAAECHGKNLQKQTISEWMQAHRARAR